ncbi:ribosome assembly RNA-binding protein YhbY [Aliicoccus persicus]|uniref:RNA-binding protein n=1 Tax=Aliicoccus persicus TaxID=930138 RepID=A0A662Z1I1_9STAP|nr:ribosome assembly RNA-binding protein YhbY [Aliicoccus persicus]SEV85403.1 RNA-binding protein [Aliicoccus persicus]
MTLTSKQVSQLKNEAHHLNPLFQIGKNGINDNFISQIDDLLEKRELIKISVLQNAEEDKKDLADQISMQTNSEIVTVIGNTIILYRESTNNKRIELV